MLVPAARGDVLVILTYEDPAEDTVLLDREPIIAWDIHPMCRPEAVTARLGAVKTRSLWEDAPEIVVYGLQRADGAVFSLEDGERYDSVEAFQAAEAQAMRAVLRYRHNPGQP